MNIVISGKIISSEKKKSEKTNKDYAIVTLLQGKEVVDISCTDIEKLEGFSLQDDVKWTVNFNTQYKTLKLIDVKAS